MVALVAVPAFAASTRGDNVVDSDATVLLVVLRPVEVDVLKLVKLLLVVLRPVEVDVLKLVKLLLVVLRPVEVDVLKLVKLRSEESRVVKK